MTDPAVYMSVSLSDCSTQLADLVKSMHEAADMLLTELLLDSSVALRHDKEHHNLFHGAFTQDNTKHQLSKQGDLVRQETFSVLCALSNHKEHRHTRYDIVGLGQNFSQQCRLDYWLPLGCLRPISLRPFVPQILWPAAIQHLQQCSKLKPGQTSCNCPLVGTGTQTLSATVHFYTSS